MSKRTSYRQRYSEFGTRRNDSSNKTYFTPFPDRLKYKMWISHTEMKNILNLNCWDRIVGPTWNLHKVSPLRDVKYEEVNLKRYAVRIKKELVNHIEESKNVAFDTKLSLLHDSNEDPNYPSILQIEVKMIKNSDDPRLKYRGILLPADVNEDSDLTFTPLLICIGAINVTRIVHQAIAQIFDAVIYPLKISSEDLKWLSVLVCDLSMNDSHEAHFDFEIPNMKLKTPIQITLPCSAIKQLWNNIHNPESDEVMCEEVFDFYKYINAQLQSAFGIRFNRLKLQRIRFPNVVISCEGKVKIQNVVISPKVFSFLKQLAVILETPEPSLSAGNFSC